MVLRVLLFIFCVLEVTKITNSLPTQLKVDGNVTITDNLNTVENESNKQTKIDRKNNSIEGSGNNSGILYLDESKTIFNYTHGYNRSLSEIPPPKCDDRGFCEEVSHYPTEIVEKALQSKENLALLENQPADPKPKFGGDGNDGLCRGVTKYIIPRVARNKNGESKYIINTYEYVQSLSVEICENVDTPCRLIDGFASGYQTMCIQKYTYRKLAAISYNGEVYADWFQMPASCCCKIQFINLKRRF